MDAISVYHITICGKKVRETQKAGIGEGMSCELPPVAKSEVLRIGSTPSAFLFAELLCCCPAGSESM